ncbi:PREDICTED: uncharacterized protein LOC107358047 [Acropora digitifera]|uniref:uncharacterized protein LOC107358047 n=1 Tax=Acropora digitifera TaxID=70779 RepID=UPI00077AA032|nr:PREDICTED: uncharacterized protein LOC107358047 [Acropora digitifera]
MEDRHRTILCDDYRPNIVKDLEPNNILPDLGRVLTVNDDEEIKAQSTRQRRCEKLLEILPRKGPNAFKVFVEALKKEAPHLADDLMAAGNKEDRNQSSAFRNLGTKKSFSLECGLISDCCEMEKKHRTILRDDYRPNIIKDLEPNDILPDLGRVLTVNDDDEIKAQSTRQRRCEKLLEILPRKGPNAFKVFVEALKKEAAHLADDLMKADELKTKLEAEKQDHPKMTSLHETFKTETSQQIQKLAEIVQHLTCE